MPLLFVSGDMDPVGNYGKGVKQIYENYKLHICELEIIACISIIILTVLGTFLTITKKEEQGIGEFFVLISIFINGLLFIL